MRQALILTGLTLAILLAACADGGSETTPTATLEPAATATLEPGLTGFAELDAVLDVLFAGDVDAVRDLVSFSAVACVAEYTRPDGNPILCRPDEPDGTAVDAFPHLACQAIYIRPEDMDGAYLSLASPSGRLYAAYRAPDASWPPAQFIAVYTDSVTMSPGSALAVSITDGRIVGRFTGCGHTTATLIEYYGLENPVLPPRP